VVVETDAGARFTKLRGAAQGTGALVAEVIVAALAKSLGLRVPERSLIRFASDVQSDDQNDELADLLRASVGMNLGFAYLDDVRHFVPATDMERVRQTDAETILWLDGLVANLDRTARNPNLLCHGDDLWLIDHGAALSFQYALPDVDAAVARRQYLLREPHLFQGRAVDLEAVDRELASRLPADVIERAVGEVPDEFLAPLLKAGDVATPERLAERRAAYVGYLSSRLAPPRPFLTPVLAPPNEQRRRGRPAWVGPIR
jgi:hypothetical protein